MGLFSRFTNRHLLNELSSFNDARLNDLGLNRYDLLDARHVKSKRLGDFLSKRRAERAHFWLR